MPQIIERVLGATIKRYLFRGRVVIIYGARRVGKTTLVKGLLEEFQESKQTRYINCDDLANQRVLAVQEAVALKTFLGDQDLVILDEAQNVPDIGRVLKILVDTYPEMQIIATGSSSFDLANKAAEPMTGRVFPFELYPLSLQEVASGRGYIEIEQRLENLLRFGLYPDILDEPAEDARMKLNELVSNYLYKDILAYAGVRKSNVIANLLRLLALQLGNQVSYNELAQNLGVDGKTVASYIDVLEQCFVIFRLTSFSRNLRNELKKSFKVYFYDLGVRNALIQAYNPLSLRADVGALWENFCIVERLKLNKYSRRDTAPYFWRTRTQKEIDYLEEYEGRLYGFEFKWGVSRPFSPPREFLEAYQGSIVERIDRSNYWQYLLLPAA
ncbi:MAG: ATP-binding protein [Caldilineaceae bacterium]|nr:ATP-binding protein [Caldilineaceae bacterium]MCB0138418.1 ATP-binding protein [Caldilineaceae bacterium]